MLSITFTISTEQNIHSNTHFYKRTIAFQIQFIQLLTHFLNYVQMFMVQPHTTVGSLLEFCTHCHTVKISSFFKKSQTCTSHIPKLLLKHFRYTQEAYYHYSHILLNFQTSQQQQHM